MNLNIPVVFHLDDKGHAYNTFANGMNWVVNGDGIATILYDGRPAFIEAQRVFRRFDLKKGDPQPSGFKLFMVSAAEHSRYLDGSYDVKRGWLRVLFGSEPMEQDIPYLEAHAAWTKGQTGMNDGLYECIETPDGFRFVSHTGDESILDGVKRTFEGMFDFLRECKPPIKGIVFHHPDGRMAKIRRKDFGLKWPSD